MIAGVGGAVGSTVAAGVTLFRRGLAQPTGLLTEAERMPLNGVFGEGDDLIRDALKLPRLEDIHVGGWDVFQGSFDEILATHQVVSEKHCRAIAGAKDVAHIFPGWMSSDGTLRRAHTGETAATWRSAVEQIRNDIRTFRLQHELDQVVVVCLLPTRPSVPMESGHERSEIFEKLLDGSNVAAVSADMAYLYSAIQEGCAWVNFTPNYAEVPALVELAIQKGTPLAGRDGKTGQTLVKTVLAPAFRARQLKVRGWFSTNILGNKDGQALRDPAALKNKLETKASALDSILGYRVGGDESSHVVTIHYYAPRGDAKEAWDNIDIEGFLGAQMQVKVNFLCKVSILAAPLVIDMARLSTIALRRGDRGFLPWMGGFFKYPLMPNGQKVEHDFFKQLHALGRYLEEAKRSQA
jgi:myo-inositol-1-phosphate synthase